MLKLMLCPHFIVVVRFLMSVYVFWLYSNVTVHIKTPLLINGFRWNIQSFFETAKWFRKKCKKVRDKASALLALWTGYSFSMPAMSLPSPVFFVCFLSLARLTFLLPLRGIFVTPRGCKIFPPRLSISPLSVLQYKVTKYIIIYKVYYYIFCKIHKNLCKQSDFATST